MSGQTRNEGQVFLRKDRIEGPRPDHRNNAQHDIYREPVDIDTVRGRVRDLQSRGKPRNKENGSSADSRGRAGPISLSSAVFVGHGEQVLALAQQQDVMFSASADGTAKVSVLVTLSP